MRRTCVARQRRDAADLDRVGRGGRGRQAHGACGKCGVDGEPAQVGFDGGAVGRWLRSGGDLEVGDRCVGHRGREVPVDQHDAVMTVETPGQELRGRFERRRCGRDRREAQPLERAQRCVLPVLVPVGRQPGDDAFGDFGHAASPVIQS